MVNISHKSNMLRQAVATAIINVSSQSTIDAVKNKTVPKGDVFEFSRAAGLLAIKKTSDAIPDCHPLPVEYAAITYKMEGLQIQVTVEVHTIYKTGVEVEAMHGAAITALTIYDMLKPIDKQTEIGTIKLLSKKGGKTDFNQPGNKLIQIAVIICSDSIASGINEDISGKVIIQKLTHFNLTANKYEIIPDSIEQIQNCVQSLSLSGYDLVLVSGGTGVSAKDITPEAIKPLIEKELPGISETLRSYGQQRTPYAMLSRGVAGFIRNTLVITIPGSVKAAAESMDALFPQVLHVFKVLEGERHEP